MIINEINEFLNQNKDDEYAKFSSKLIPNIKEETIIGVRIPILRKYAKTLMSREDLGEFLDKLPHYYIEEYMLHAFILENFKDFDRLIEYSNKFLIYIDNWAVCDTFSPKIFKKNLDKLIKHIYIWLESEHIYTKRFAIGMLMSHYQGDLFKKKYSELVSNIKTSEYYINMMTAWYFATLLAKQYDVAIEYLKEHKLDKWTHNKTIQKAIESYRISYERKKYLKTLKIAK